MSKQALVVWPPGDEGPDTNVGYVRVLVDTAAVYFITMRAAVGAEVDVAACRTAIHRIAKTPGARAVTLVRDLPSNSIPGIAVGEVLGKRWLYYGAIGQIMKTPADCAGDHEAASDGFGATFPDEPPYDAAARLAFVPAHSIAVAGQPDAALPALLYAGYASDPAVIGRVTP